MVLASPGPLMYSSTTASSPESWCRLCDTGKYLASTSASACTNCPENSTSLAGSSLLTSCQCNAGHSGPDRETCKACTQGQFKYTIGSAECFFCSAGMYSASVNTPCLSCSAGTYMPGFLESEVMEPTTTTIEHAMLGTYVRCQLLFAPHAQRIRHLLLKVVDVSATTGTYHTQKTGGLFLHMQSI
jgi:hypothetical protein